MIQLHNPTSPAAPSTPVTPSPPGATHQVSTPSTREVCTPSICEVSAPSTREELERLGEEIAALAADLHAGTYRLLVRLGDFDQRDGWNSGFLSCAHWLRWRTGIAPGAAREQVRVARALPDLPGISQAMERGELSYSKVRALTRIATPANEEELLELARYATAAQVEIVVRAWRRVDRVAEAEAERARHERRYLTVRVDDDGSYVLRGRLDPEVGALLERALEEASRALYEVQEPGVPVTGTATPGPERPTAAQRRADALGLLAELALGNREVGMEAAAPAPGSISAISASSCLDEPDASSSPSPLVGGGVCAKTGGPDASAITRVCESAFLPVRRVCRSCCTSMPRRSAPTPTPANRSSPAASPFPRERRGASPVIRVGSS